MFMNTKGEFLRQNLGTQEGHFPWSGCWEVNPESLLLSLQPGLKGKHFDTEVTVATQSVKHVRGKMEILAKCGSDFKGQGRTAGLTSFQVKLMPHFG